MAHMGAGRKGFYAPVPEHQINLSHAGSWTIQNWNENDFETEIQSSDFVMNMNAESQSQYRIWIKRSEIQLIVN